MPETGATFHPKPLTFVQADPMTEHLAALLGTSIGRVAAGMNLTYDGLTAHISKGQAIIVTDGFGDVNNPPSAYYIKFTAQVDKALNPSTTNYLFLTATADVVVNTTGTPPADSIPLYTIVTGASAVTGTPADNRSTVIVIGTKVKANGLDLNGNELTNLGAPGSGSSAARYSDLTTAIAAIGGIKNPVRAATTASITLSGLQTIDGVVLVSQDRVLVKNQGTASQNGIYVAQTGAWVRATDFDATVTVKGGTLIPVSEGTVNGNSIYGLDTDDPIVIATTGLTFTRKDVQEHAALTIAHGATSAATVSSMVARDAAGRSKFIAGAAAGDALVFGQSAGGDLTGTLEAPTIGLNKVDDTKLRDSAALSVIGRSANTSGDPADIAAGTDGYVLRRSGTTLGFGQLGTSSYVVNSVDDTIIRQGAALTVIGRSANTVGNVADIAGTANLKHVLRVSGTTLGFGTVDHTYISDFDAQVRTSRLDQMATPTAAVSFGNQELTNLGTPTADTSGARRGDVGGTSLVYKKTFDRALRSAPIDLPNVVSIGGLACVPLTKDIVMLIWCESTTIKKAIYTFSTETWGSTTTVVTDASGPISMLAHAADANNIMVVYVTNQGDGGSTAKSVVTTNGGTSWGSAVTIKATTAYSATHASGIPIDLTVLSSTAAYVIVTDSTSLKFYSTSDFGTSWSAGTAIESGVIPPAVGMSVVSSSVIYVAYQLSGTQVRVKKSTNSGSTWTTKADITVDPNNGSASPFHLYAPVSGKFFLAFNDGTSSRPYGMAESYDDGTTVILSSNVTALAASSNAVNFGNSRWRDSRDGFYYVSARDGGTNLALGFLSFHGMAYVAGAFEQASEVHPLANYSSGSHPVSIGLTPDKNYLMIVTARNSGNTGATILRSRYVATRVTD